MSINNKPEKSANIKELSSINDLNDYKNLFKENKSKMELKLREKIIKSISSKRVFSELSRDDTVNTLNSQDNVDQDPMDDVKISEKNKNPRWQMNNSGLFPLKQIDQVLSQKINQKLHLKGLKSINKTKNTRSMNSISRKKQKSSDRLMSVEKNYNVSLKTSDDNHLGSTKSKITYSNTNINITKHESTHSLKVN